MRVLPVGRRLATVAMGMPGMSGTPRTSGTSGTSGMPRMPGTVVLTILGVMLWGMLGQASAGQLLEMGGNGGVRLLLHCAGPVHYPEGKPAEDPCLNPPILRSTQDFVTEYSDAADTVMVWAYLYHPCRFAVRGVGFGIRYEGIDVVTSGTCADLVYQDGEAMGKWAQSGSEIAFAWKGDNPGVIGILAPVAWFLLAREKSDGYFETWSGNTAFSGAVADTSALPLRDPIFAYGRVGFGATDGALPIEEPEKVAGAWGAVTISAH
jgi:hypothetical protein